jgi:hypothetical protein
MYHCQKTAMSQVQEKTKQNPETNKNITIYNNPTIQLFKTQPPTLLGL